MRTRTLLVSLAVFFAGFALCFAADAQMGTWKLNEGKSKFTPGSMFHTVVYAAEGDNVKITVDGVDKDGKPTHNEWTGKFDGKDYPIIGDPNADSRSYKMVDDRTLAMTIKKGGKVTITGTIAVSADGKTRTVSTSGVTPAGVKIANEAVYDKQ
jgi:hypothetical protein